MSAGFFAAASQTSGVVSWLKDIWNTVASIPNMIFTAFQYYFSALLYGIQMGFFWIIDMVQAVFRKLAGLDIYWYKESNGSMTQQTGDIVESFIRSDTVWNVFLSVMIASIILLFVTTFIAVLKTEFAEKDNAKGPVIKSALKAVVYFVTVPVVCVFGIALANIFLRSFDSATAYKGATSISGQVFAASSFNASRIRNGHLTEDEDLSDVKERLMNTAGVDPKIRSSSSKAEIADALDFAFVHDLSTTKDVAYDFTDKGDYMAGYTYILARNTDPYHNKSFDKYNLTLVYYYYDLVQYNYLIGYMASFTIIMLLLNLMIGVIERLFNLTILFIISPAFIATMPLDGGSRYNKWKEEFIKKTLGLYGPIVGINLAFTILTLVQRIYVFDPAGGALFGLFNTLMQCIFVITAIICVKDFGKLINTLVGGEDISTNHAADVSGKLQKMGAVGARAAVGAAKIGVGALKAGYQGARAFGHATRAGIRSHVQEHQANRSFDAYDEQEQAKVDEAEERLRVLGEEDESITNRGEMRAEWAKNLTEEQKAKYKGNAAQFMSDSDEYIEKEIRARKARNAARQQWRNKRDEAANNIATSQQGRAEMREMQRSVRRNNRSNFLREGIANPVTTVANATADAGQDFYKAGQTGWQNSDLYAATKTFRDAGGSDAVEDFREAISPQAVNNAVKAARADIKATKTAKKNKEKKDAAEQNAALAKAIADALRGGGTP